MRIEQLTFTRFLAAIFIVIFHRGRHLFPSESHFLASLINQGNVAVSYFFLLSGYVMVIAYGSRSRLIPYDFYVRRAARICPVYFLAILLLAGLKILLDSSLSFSDLGLNLLLVQAWIPGRALSFNSPGWSLSVEFFFYAVFPLFFNLLYVKYHWKKMLFPVTILWIASQVLFHVLVNSSFYGGYSSQSHDILYYFPLMHLSEFLVGNVAGLMFLRMETKVKNRDISLVALALVIVAVLGIPAGLNFHNGLLALVFIPFIFTLSANSGFVTKIFSLRPLVFLGEASYGIYILQKPVFIGLSEVLNRAGIDNSFLKFGASLVVLIVVAGLSYIYFETPLRRKINNLSASGTE